MLTPEQIAMLEPGAALIWNTVEQASRFKERTLRRVPFVRATARRIIVLYGCRQVALDPRWLRLPTAREQEGHSLEQARKAIRVFAKGR